MLDSIHGDAVYPGPVEPVASDKGSVNGRPRDHIPRVPAHTRMYVVCYGGE
jgi:hypothetical protein